MGLIGEVYAYAGLHVDSASFAQYASMLEQTDTQMKDFSEGSKAALATVFTGASVAITGVLAYGTSIASTFEDASTTLTTVYGDLDVAKEKFTWLADFAASTPFEFPELLDATVKLKSYGIEAQDYMGTIGDASAAMGKTLDETTEAVADAMTGEFERLKEYGIKAIQITNSNYQQMGATMSQVGMTALQYTNKAGEEQYKIVDRNNRKMVLSSIQSIWDIEKGFKGAMETRSKTLTGMMSTLKDNLTLGLTDIIGFNIEEMDAQAGSLLGVFKELIGAAVDLTSNLTEIPEPVQTFIAVAAVGGAVALALAGGLVAASLAGITAEAVMGALGVAVSTVLWPTTLIVGTLALVAAGLIYLDEKTGLVTAAWQLFSDMATIVWYGLKGTVGGVIDWISTKLDEMSQSASEMGFGELSGVVDSIGTSWDNIKARWADGVSNVHDSAERYKESAREVELATSEAAAKTFAAENDAYGALTLWSGHAWDWAQDIKDANYEAQTSIDQTSTAYEKAVADLLLDTNKTSSAGIGLMSGVSIDDLTRGIRTLNDELIILNDNNELVKVSADGAVTPLKDMGTITFETATGGLTIFTDGLDDSERSAEILDGTINKMGNDVVVLDSKGLDTLNTEITTVDGSVTTANSDTLTWEQSLQRTNSLNFDVVNGEVVGVTIVERDAKTQADLLKGSLDTVNATPFTTISGNLVNLETLTYNDKSQADVLNSAFGTTNLLPFGTIHGNLSSIGIFADTDKGKTDNLNSSLNTTNISPFGTLFGNLVTGGVRVDTLKGKTDDANTSIGTLGSFSFSGTISGLGGVYNKLVDIYNQAKTTISKLLEVGNTSSSGSSKSSVYGYTASEAATRKANNTVYNNNVKINTVNNNGSKVQTNKVKSVV